MTTRGCPHTGRVGAVDGLDQPSTAGAPAALPGFSRTIRQHAPRVEGVRRTSWGYPRGGKMNEAADLLSSVRRTPQGTVCAPHTCLLCYGHVFVLFTLPPIGDDPVLNLLSR